jgi:hypothetical protein
LSLLLPLDITLEPTNIEWLSVEKYQAWTDTLRREEFELLGAHQIREVRFDLELWCHSAEDLVAEVVNDQQAGMWVCVFTRYEDGSSFGVSNKKNFGLIDPHPTKKIVHIGADATAEQVIDKARRERPEGGRHPVVPSSILADYATAGGNRLSGAAPAARRLRNSSAFPSGRLRLRQKERLGISVPTRNKERRGPSPRPSSLLQQLYDLPTCSLLSTLNAPNNWLARIPAMFLSIALSTTP